jgi:hypothetical protein
MLASAVRPEIEQRLAELLFVDDAPLAPANPVDPVDPVQRSTKAKAKATSKRTQSGLPAHNFVDLLDALATLTRNRIRLASHDASFDQLPSRPASTRAPSSSSPSTPPGCSQKPTARQNLDPAQKARSNQPKRKNFGLVLAGAWELTDRPAVEPHTLGDR